MTVAALSAADLERFCRLVERELGLRFDGGGRQTVARALIRRLADQQEPAADYLDRLDANPAEEMLALASELTTGETHFLRHPEQFQALTRTVLPALLGASDRTVPLRLLSAGCSTGEEAYSLAIALRESKSASILGVDVNPVSLAQARSGRYAHRSLRSVPVATQERWFTLNGQDVILDPAIWRAVQFEHRNIAQADPEFWRPGAFDVVFCRNVIMYFTPEVMTRVVGQIARSLTPGGYLFLGSAETLRGLSDDFEIRQSQGTFYYQRRPEVDRPSRRPAGERQRAASDPALGPALEAAPGSTPAPILDPEPGPGTTESLDPVLDLLRRERFADALARMEELIDPNDDGPEVLLLRAALLIDCGRIPAAEQACRRLLEVDRRSAGAHVLLALCREGQQDLPAAVDHCRTAITLDPGFAMPHVHLGRLARRLGDHGSADRQFIQSVRLLPAETSHRILIFGGGFDREALISQCRDQRAAVAVER